MTIAQQIKWDFKANGDLQIRDKNGNQIYYENSNGYWSKREWDSQGNEIYYESSHGTIRDNRPKYYEGKIVEFGGEKFKLVKV
jgi:hypothetical protein